MGWLDLAVRSAEDTPELETFATEIRDAGIERVFLLGMGGSSLAPEVFKQVLGSRPGWPSLEILDSTHPDAVSETSAGLDPERSLFVVASKSGSTIETMSLFRFFWQQCSAAGGLPGARFVAITDPGSSLEALALEEGFRRVFRAPVDVGGRFSALSVFGLVPAALIGVDVGRLLRAARDDGLGHEGLLLGAAVAEAALAGRDKLTFLTSPELSSLPDWLDQLVAESLGKEGKGVVSVAHEPLGPITSYGRDRIFVALRGPGDPGGSLEELLKLARDARHPVIEVWLDEPLELGAEMYRWEIAVAAIASALEVDPFGQPDVELAKQLARRVMAGTAIEGAVAPVEVEPGEQLVEELRTWLASAVSDGYVGLQAFVQPTAEADRAFRRLQGWLRDRTGLAVTAGFGPRFLHSTGQLHKGGPRKGLFLQFVDQPEAALPVPGTDYSFGQLVRAQADGDAAALTERGRSLLRVNLGSAPVENLERLTSSLDRAIGLTFFA
jgi:transaldolase/glucose-6-phosphate isomerase